MKSAYELAMERFGEAEPVAALTDEQRADLAAIEEKFKAKIAEKEVFLGDLIAKARATGRWDEVPALDEQRIRETKRLREQGEAEKEKVRKG